MVNLRDHPDRWIEDEYAGESQKYIGTRRLDETLTAAYLQGRLQVGPLRVLAGVRREQVDVNAFAYVKGTKTPATSITDPRELARFDYSNPRYGSGSSRSYFPSAHFTYQVTRGLQARASWSNGVGRPATANLLPVETVNQAAETVTINNQSIKPQFTRNYDVSLEYYFLYRKARALLNVSTSYALRPGTELFCNIENVFDEPQEWYRYKPERHQASNFNGTAVFFGVNGRL